MHAISTQTAIPASLLVKVISDVDGAKEEILLTKRVDLPHLNAVDLKVTNPTISHAQHLSKLLTAQDGHATGAITLASCLMMMDSSSIMLHVQNNANHQHGRSAIN